MTAATYTDKNHRPQTCYNALTPGQTEELKRHAEGCDAPREQCNDCWLLYVSIGQEEFDKLLDCPY